jgi:hypothetical protein
VATKEVSRDVEKGTAPLQGKAPENTKGGEEKGGWVARLWGNDWK